MNPFNRALEDNVIHYFILKHGEALGLNSSSNEEVIDIAIYVRGMMIQNRRAEDELGLKLRTAEHIPVIEKEIKREREILHLLTVNIKAEDELFLREAVESYKKEKASGNKDLNLIRRVGKEISLARYSLERDGERGDILAPARNFYEFLVYETFKKFQIKLTHTEVTWVYNTLNYAFHYVWGYSIAPPPDYCHALKKASRLVKFFRRKSVQNYYFLKSMLKLLPPIKKIREEIYREELQAKLEEKTMKPPKINAIITFLLNNAEELNLYTHQSLKNKLHELIEQISSQTGYVSRVEGPVVADELKRQGLLDEPDHISQNDERFLQSLLFPKKRVVTEIIIRTPEKQDLKFSRIEDLMDLKDLVTSLLLKSGGENYVGLLEEILTKINMIQKKLTS